MKVVILMQESNQLPLTEVIAPVYRQLHLNRKRHLTTHNFLEGGRNSAKSSDATIEIILDMIEDKRASAMAIRRFQKTLASSVYNQFLWAIDFLHLNDEFTWTQSPLRIKRKGTNQTIEFAALNNEEDYRKIKSYKPGIGTYFKDILYEECDEFTAYTQIQQTNLTLMRGGPYFNVYYVSNAPFNSNHWYTVKSRTKRKDYYYLHTTVYDIPKEWTTEAQWEDINYMKEHDPEEFKHRILGLPGNNDLKVFTNIYEYRYDNIDDKVLNSWDTFACGLDFGYRPDPTAYVVWYYDKVHNDLYAIGEVYEIRLKTEEIYNRIRDCQEETGIDNRITSEIDNRIIDELYDFGLDIEAAEKGPKSREFGVKWLQNLDHIYIDVNKTPNIWREFTSFEFIKDKYDNITSKTQDGNDHTIDATRYACEQFWKHSKIQLSDRRII